MTVFFFLVECLRLQFYHGMLYVATVPTTRSHSTTVYCLLFTTNVIYKLSPSTSSRDYSVVRIGTETETEAETLA